MIEGITLESAGKSPYSGDIFHQVRIAAGIILFAVANIIDMFYFSESNNVENDDILAQHLWKTHRSHFHCKLFFFTA